MSESSREGGSPQVHEASHKIESEEALDQVDNVVLKLAKNKFFLQSVIEDAKGQIPYWRTTTSASGKDEDRNFFYQHVSGVLDAYDHINDPQNDELKNKIKIDAGQHADYYEHRVREYILKNAEKKTEKFQEDLKQGKEPTQKKLVRETHDFIAGLDPEVKEIILNKSGLSPETVKQKLFRWGITVPANVASTYALEGIAVLAGTGLAKLGLHDNIGNDYLLGFLGASYGMWGWGTLKGVKANWNLLEQEGVSTSVLSKTFYDYAKSRGWSERAQKIAAGAGYVLLEVAKEGPYYAGAIGAATFLESMTDKDAIVFLAGANLGAGVYEYGLSVGTEKVLKARRNRAQKKVKHTMEPKTLHPQE